MKYLKKLRKEEEGFTLVELILVVIIMGILAQLGIVSFNRYNLRTRAFVARIALINIKRECEMNRDLGMDETFTPLTPRGYSLQSRSSNSCLGQSGSGLVSAIPDNQDEYPSYFYNFAEGSISCNYSSTADKLFSECMSIGSKNKNQSSSIASTLITPDKGNEVSCDNDSIQKHRNWHHKCKWTKLDFVTNEGTANSGSGSLTLLQDGTLEYKGTDKDDLLRKEINLVD